MDKSSDADYLRQLAEILRRIPLWYGVDNEDVLRLLEIADVLDLAI